MGLTNMASSRQAKVHCKVPSFRKQRKKKKIEPQHLGDLIYNEQSPLLVILDTK